MKEGVKLKGFFWQLCSPHKFSMGFFVFCAGFAGLHGLINSFFIKKIIDTLGVLDLKLLLPIGICVVLNFEVHNLCWRVINYLILKKTPIIKNQIISKAFAHVHKQSLGFFEGLLSGSVANDVKVLADQTEKVFFSIAIRLIRGGVQFFVALVSMYFVHFVFSMVLLVWGAIFVAVSLVFSRKIANLSDSYADAQSKVSGRVFDSISNFFTVKTFSRAKQEEKYLGVSLDKVTGNFQKRGWFLLKFYFVQGSSITVLIGAMVYFLIRFQLQGQITMGEFAYILGATFYVTEYLWTFTENLDQVNDALGNCRQAYRALFSPIVCDGKRSLHVKNGEISCNNLLFSYGESSLFSDLSVEISAGEKVGIVGRTGSGKSTFAKLLLRLYDPCGGEVLIDGQNIAEVTEESLRESISLIPQTPSLFHRTIWENIAYGKLDATDEEVFQAAKKAQIHEFIMNLPSKYETIVGERGVKLSGGQKQRIALARGMIKQAPILILDEATSQLDSITEEAIQKELFYVMDGKTTIVIAHRLSTLLKMDRILVFDNGKIIEEGSHNTLLDLRGMYHQLWVAQTSDARILEKLYTV